MSKIKICGLTRMDDIKYVNEYMPDYIGFVFSKSKRQITRERARLLKKELCSNVLAVGVFVNEPAAMIAELAGARIIDMIQLHGDEDKQYIDSLKSTVSCPIIKAVRVQSAEQVLAAQTLACDYLLLDAYCKDSYGGTGKGFNWDIIPKHLQKPFFLAGGLNAGNITDAVRSTSPYCVDVSSAAETNGIKDRDKIKAIIETVRSVNNV